jgi:DNA helicase II / ATP-dependent DNA helicase PcrA
VSDRPPTPASTVGAPRLEGPALDAVGYRGGHLQIIASAGSGKTEVVSQRVASLLADGVAPAGIVAFTFTERAAEELKHRISLRVEERLGPQALDRLGGLFVGTIHAYCFRFLQQRVPRFETYDVLDDHQLTGFLSRGAKQLGIRQLDPDGKDRLYASIAAFVSAVDVVENELLDPATLPEPLRTVLLDYYDSLERYRLLTYGQQVARAVEQLERPEIAADVHAELRHLVVDEYQDVNPAQERLIRGLTGPDTHLCVVGDDDQAVYQWRGSEVSNIITFAGRYPDVATFEITVNRRSRPGIVNLANGFAGSIAGRLPKSMAVHRDAAGAGGPEVVLWRADDEPAEAGWLAYFVDALHDAGLPYRDIAVLVRGRVAYPKIVEQFATFGIPVQPGGRTGLFDQPEAKLLGRTICWLSDIEWRDPWSPGAAVADDVLLDGYTYLFDLDGAARVRVRHFLDGWKMAVPNERRVSNLVGELYDLLGELQVRNWDLADPLKVNRLGTFARFSAVLADYEAVRRRAKPDPDSPGEQIGGQDRGVWYYRNLATHIVNYAQGAYEAFDGEADATVDAVDLTTIHRAKGLEWPAVFVPSLTARRFPSSRTGQKKNWLLPRDRFPASRYEGSDADERRLFYVALTRARDWLSVSRHARTAKQAATSSPYLNGMTQHEVDPADVVLPDLEAGAESDEPLALSYSELASYLSCGLAYRLRTLIGFQPRLATELGYGKAVHHVLRTVAEITRATGKVPTAAEIDEILDRNFFLPTANKTAHRELKDAARRLIVEYITTHAADLHRIWETERPFELHVEGITVSGRADVILDHEGGAPTALAILDYKTSASDLAEHALQLQVYTDAGRREGLDVRAAYVHDLKAGARSPVDVGSDAVNDAEELVKGAAIRLRKRDYAPNPGTVCRRCEVRTICPVAKR